MMNKLKKFFIVVSGTCVTALIGFVLVMTVISAKEQSDYNREWRQWESQHSLSTGVTIYGTETETGSLTTQQIEELARKQAQQSLAKYKKCVFFLNPTLCSIL